MVDGTSKKITVFLVLMLLTLLSINGALAIVDSHNVSAFEGFNTVPKDTIVQDPTKEGCVYYFYGDGCKECEETTLHINLLKEQYPNVQIQAYEVYHTKENLESLNALYDAFSVSPSSQGVPVVFFSKTYFIGKEPIISFTNEQIMKNKDHSCPTLESKDVIGIVGQSQSQDILRIISIFDMVGIAIKNIFKPVSVALLMVYLMLTLSFLKVAVKGHDVNEVKENFTNNTGLFLTSMFIGMLFLGFGFLPVTFFAQFSAATVELIGILSVIIGVVSMKHFLVPKPQIISHLLTQFKPIFRKILEFLQEPKGFVITSLIAALILTSGWSSQYQILINLLSDPNVRWRAFPLFLWHSVLILLSYFVIAWLVTVRLKMAISKDKSVVRIHHVKISRFIIAFILMILGLVVLFV